MKCSLPNTTQILSSFGGQNASLFDIGNSTDSGESYSSKMAPDAVSHFVRIVLVPIICVFGVLGNVLTLLVLTRKRLKVTCDGTERMVHIGLAALAVSDLLFCLSSLPHGFYAGNRYDYSTKSFELLYRTYSHAFINTFILTSTWLTVTMATSRYLAICHPFKARHLIGMKGTKVSVALVYLAAMILNIPRLFDNKIKMMCIKGELSYFFFADYDIDVRRQTIYSWVYFTVGIFLPLLALAFCNICLVRALRESSRIRKRYRVPAAHVDSNYRITSILVTIVIMYILLVSPAEITHFVGARMPASTTPTANTPMVIAIEVTNVLQNLNFSCNFILYFVLNVHFRHGLRDLLCLCAAFPCLPERRRRRKDIRLHRQMSLKTTQTTL
ncbi:hypothetical protein CAPTEDRAFT_199151 [Capitella teleta]|uniref:G-protein coupled receptors family 1 profile domain-containing protein n=1 Tax=Capitella teleta TaxID=283909 RepID=R7VDS2_CAPTE|nr:hypothetical protein CAPTEDRAFT_199151 [Capitella teleta]|eukprot:ELU16687.1 hypothetical protein CAPTEDRAFT_199151 [Capitella teleta]